MSRARLGVLLALTACRLPSPHESGSDSRTVDDSSVIGDSSVTDDISSGSDSGGVDDSASTGCSDKNAASIGKLYFATVQEALDHAVDGDVIQVCAGTHQEHLSLVPAWGSNPLFKDGGTISIVGDPKSPTTIDGGSELDEIHGSTINTERVALILSWLTVTGGTGDRVSPDEDIFWYLGGGVGSCTDLTLDHVSITGNTASWGGGIAMGSCPGGVLTITSSVISDNDLARGKKEGTAAIAGGVLLGEFTTLDATDTDWGSGATDNQPDDIGMLGGTHGDFTSYRVPIDAKSVHCDGGTFTCVFDPPKK